MSGKEIPGLRLNWVDLVSSRFQDADAGRNFNRHEGVRECNRPRAARQTHSLMRSFAVTELHISAAPVPLPVVEETVACERRLFVLDVSLGAL